MGSAPGAGSGSTAVPTPPDAGPASTATPTPDAGPDAAAAPSSVPASPSASPSVPGELVVEADGGSRGNPGPAGYGAVVADAVTGELLAERAGFLGVATNNVAEYSGLLAGLRAARLINPAASVRVRMDSKLVVEQMSGRWQIKHPALRPLAAEAARVLPGAQVGYEWIPRSQNKRADRLANKAMDAGQRGEVEAGEEIAGYGDAEAGARTPVAGTTRAPVTASAPTPAGSAALAPARPGALPEPGPGGPAASGADTLFDFDASPGALPDAGPAVTDPGARPAPTGTRTPPRPRPAAGTPTPDHRAARNLAAPDLGTPATLVLLRHGETPLTPQKRFSGSGGSDPGLSEAGREQAARAAEALARRGTIEAVVTSPLARTRETAEAAAVRLGLDVVVEDGLRETDFGAWESLTFGEVRERYPDDMNAWLGDPQARPTGGGESFAEVAARVAAACERLTAAYAGRTVLVVSHVTPIKTLIRLALGAPPEALFRLHLDAASLSAVAYYADGNASVRLVNDTSHLR
ncbi:bifunctional RNase H/acid phosphatase [Streptomyces roseirectus]|uniref:Bifunctional RNase H/acid phosphatase n=1 Tax=Streptomyces roseirectus TaxID=2768066 RepID=A0A7H0IJP5_9ACTN|nr:bifunctional RNase H/acid phosphatase [Streptomyces roseirectus]QNP73011.1 bifunctional RNase H/acid phosphatase [Streptomyces roseirectus]